MDIDAFQDAFHAAGLALSLRGRKNNFVAGASDWLNLQAPQGRNVLALMLEASISITASAAASVTASSDILDEWFQQIEISPAAAQAARIFVKTRIAAEELERLVFDTAQGWTSNDIAAQSPHIGSYARSQQAAFTASGTRSDTSELWVGIGGQACAFRLTIPPTSSSFQSNITSMTYTIGWFECYSIYSGTIAAFENVTATLASGNNQDMMSLNVYPSGLAADFASILKQTTTNVTAIYLIDATGSFSVNFDDTQSINAVQFVYPRFATNTPSYNTLLFNLSKSVPSQFRISLANSVALDFLWVQINGGSPAPTPTPSKTATTPEVARTGTPTQSTGPTSAPGGGTGTAGTNPTSIMSGQGGNAPGTAQSPVPLWK